MNIVPSIELIPAKYGVGTLLAQVPMDGSGDFSVTRATAVATRYNSAGLIETIASGIPRLDYYTSSGTPGCPALLVEPSAANGILNSQNTSTSWSLGANLSSGYVDVIGVSGNNLTVAVSGSNIGSAAGRLQRAGNNVALASGSTYTISFLMKKTGTHTIGGYYALITGAASGDLGAGFDVSGSFSNGSIYNTTGTTNRIRRIEQWGADVYRCSETFTMTASGTLTAFHFGPTNGVTIATNPAVGLGIAFAAPQIELGSVPTSFIPTTTGSVTRDADVINKTGVSGLIGQTEGTLYAEVDIRAFANLGIFLSISNGGGNDRIEIYKNTDSKIYFDRVSATQSGITSVSSTSTYSAGILKVAVAYKSGDTIMYINGSAATTAQTQTFTFLPITKITIGTNRADISQFNDRIRSAAIYKTRLPNYLLESATSQIQSYSALASSLSYTVV
jgi:hypothetical protein